MRYISPIISLLALGGVVVLPWLHFCGVMALDAMKTGLLAATIIWFLSAPVWMGRPRGRRSAV